MILVFNEQLILLLSSYKLELLYHTTITRNSYSPKTTEVIFRPNVAIDLDSCLESSMKRYMKYEELHALVRPIQLKRKSEKADGQSSLEKMDFATFS